MSAPGTADAVAFLRAHRAGDLDAQAAVLTAVHAGGLVAIAALALNLACLLDLACPDLDAALARVQAQLVDA